MSRLRRSILITFFLNTLHYLLLSGAGDQILVSPDRTSVFVLGLLIFGIGLPYPILVFGRLIFVALVFLLVPANRTSIFVPSLLVLELVYHLHFLHLVV